MILHHLPLVAFIDPQWMFLLGVALLAVVLLRKSFRRGRRATSQPAQASPLESRRGQAGEPVELLRWQIEMHDTARDLKAELDSKMSALSALIRQAGEERRRLEELLPERPRQRGA